MTALSADIKRDQLGGPDVPVPKLLGFPVEANTQIFNGELVATDAAGNAISAKTAGALQVWGVARSQVNNLTSNSPYGAAGAQNIQVQVGTFAFSCTDGTIVAGAVGQSVYTADGNTVSAYDGGGTRPYVGYVTQNPLPGIQPTSTAVYVCVGEANPYTTSSPLGDGGVAAYTARVVLTSLGANTGTTTGKLTVTATGALAAQDGVTLANGDLVIIPLGITNLAAASDAGPYIVGNVAGVTTGPTFTRPSWWETGATITPGVAIQVGGEGTLFAGTRWKSFAAKGVVIDSASTLLYPEKVTQAVALVTGFATKTNVPIFSLATSGIKFTPTNFNGAASTVSYRTGAYASGGAATAVGGVGTASASITALVAAGTSNTADVSTGLLEITN